MSIARASLIIVLCSVLSACYYRETFYPEVTVRETSDAGFEVQIQKHIEGRGNIHSLSLSKFEHDDSDWIYVKSITGVVEASTLVFTRHWGCLQYPWSTSDLRGQVEFRGRTLVIALEQPWYEDGKTMSGYRPLDVNGTYTVSFQKTHYQPTEIDRNGAPCSRNRVANER